jgi:hemolysin D
MNRFNHNKTRNLPMPANQSPKDAPVTRPMPRVIADFQTDAVELEERAPPRIARMTLYCITAFIAAAITWASVSEIDEVIVAPGKLITTKPTIIVQPLETSIIRTIDVTAGETVHAGQTLATLDPTFSQSDVDQKRERFSELDAQVKRIEAEIAGKDFAPSLEETQNEQIQLQLFDQRHAFVQAQLKNFDQQIAGQSAAIDSSKAQRVILNSRRDNLLKIEQVREKLYGSQNGTIINFLSARDARLDVESNLSVLQGRAIEARHAVKKLQADKQAFLEDFRRSTMDQLVELRSQRNAIAEELKKMELRRSMVVLSAPADAVVLDLAQRSVGSVVREAEPIVTLVPLNVPLEAEVSVSSTDIGRVTVDRHVRIKLDAYPFQKFGTVSGTVRTVSRDTFTPSQQEGMSSHSPAPFFKARILLSDTRLKDSSEPARLLPGMTVSAEIKVGRRTVISYFLYPLLRGLDDAIKEPNQ